MPRCHNGCCNNGDYEEEEEEDFDDGMIIVMMTMMMVDLTMRMRIIMMGRILMMEWL